MPTRPRNTFLTLSALVLVALAVAGCGGFYKVGSLKVSQPTGLGPVRVHFNTCALGEEKVGEMNKAVPCAPTGPTEGEPAELQHMIALAIPAGITPPATVTEVGIGAAPSIVLTRDDGVGAAFAAFKPEPEQTHAPWPPAAGTQIVGYISPVLKERLSDRFEWSLDPEITVPGGAPFAVTVATGSRFVEAKEFPGRPANCGSKTETFEKTGTVCEIGEAATIGTTSLTIAPPAAPATGFLGGKASLSFTFAAASSVSPPPAFALGATTTLPGATAAPSTPTYVASGLVEATNQAGPAVGTVNVTVPKTAKPGTYSVTLTAVAAGGATVSQTGSIVVKKASLKLGKAKVNTAKGTATLSVGVPGAGTLTATGKGLVKVQKKPTAARSVNLLVKPKGKVAKALVESGKAKVKLQLKFKPLSGVAVTKARNLTLKLG